MPRFEIVHRTDYAFSDWVDSAQVETVLRPRETAHAHAVSHHLSIIPAGYGRVQGIDVYGNHVERFRVGRRLRRLMLSAATVVDVAISPAAAADAAAADASDGRLGACCDGDPEDQDLCRNYAPNVSPDFDGVAGLARRIHQDITYDGSVIATGRPVAAILRDRRGMCQDFARLAIAVLRANGIRASWVTGYALPPRATAFKWLHAWFSAELPGRGWTDFDATERDGSVAGLLTLARGPTEAAVAPVRGALSNNVSSQVVSVEIGVTPLR